MNTKISVKSLIDEKTRDDKKQTNCFKGDYKENLLRQPNAEMIC